MLSLGAIGDASLALGGDSKVGLLSDGGVRVNCALGIWALGGGAIEAGGGALEFDGETGTELT